LVGNLFEKSRQTRIVTLRGAILFQTSSIENEKDYLPLLVKAYDKPL